MVDTVQLVSVPVLKLLLPSLDLPVPDITDPNFCLLSLLELFIGLTFPLILDEHLEKGEDVRRGVLRRFCRRQRTQNIVERQIASFWKFCLSGIQPLQYAAGRECIHHVIGLGIVLVEQCQHVLRFVVQ